MGPGGINREIELVSTEKPSSILNLFSLRLALFFFVLGVLLESTAVWMDHSGRFRLNCADEAVSLAAAICLVSAGLLVLDRLSRVNLLAIIAAGLYVASKFLDVTGNHDPFSYIPIIGDQDPLNRLLSQLMFVLGALLLFACFCVATVESYLARIHLESRHQALLKETEERQRAEKAKAQLFTAIEQAAESVMITNHQGIIEYVNPAFEQVSGYSAAEVIGRKPGFLKSGEFSKEFYARLWNTISNGKVWKGQFVNRTKNGVLFKEEATITPVRDEMGVIVNYVAIKRDITREDELERQLRQAQKMQAIGTLAGGIAHDFRNTLALIMGHCEIAMGMVSEENPLSLHLEKMMRAGNRAADMVKQILTFSRQGEQHRHPIDLARIVTEAHRFLQSSFPATIEMPARIDPHAGQVLADPTQMHQVVLNLCTNARQAIGTRKGRIETKLDRVILPENTLMDTGILPPGTYVRLTVSDNGLGMNETVLPHIFEPFFTTKRKEEGTGLGLSTVHGIVMACNGGIKVYSKVGEGTSFEVYLPLLERTEIHVEPDPVPVTGGSERLLLLDDDADIVKMVSQMLSGLGYRIETCTESEKALQWLRERPDDFDLLLTDNIMPKLTGVELAQQILASRPHFPIVLLTGYADGITPEEAQHMGIAGYVVKPFTEYALNLALRNALTREILTNEDAASA